MDGVREVRLRGEQCTATAKATGKRCEKLVVGGGVCRSHGGASPNARAAREARIVQMRARAYGDVTERTPAEALLAAGTSLDASLQALEQLAGRGEAPDATLLREIRSAADASGRMAKLIQDAGLDARRMQLEERDRAHLGQVMRLVLEAHGLRMDDATVRADLEAAVERVAAGDLRPLRPALGTVTRPS